MRVRNKRVLKNGVTAGYVQQKDGSWKWKFIGGSKKTTKRKTTAKKGGMMAALKRVGRSIPGVRGFIPNSNTENNKQNNINNANRLNNGNHVIAHNGRMNATQSNRNNTVNRARVVNNTVNRIRVNSNTGRLYYRINENFGNPPPVPLRRKNRNKLLQNKANAESKKMENLQRQENEKIAKELANKQIFWAASNNSLRRESKNTIGNRAIRTRDRAITNGRANANTRANVYKNQLAKKGKKRRQGKKLQGIMASLNQGQLGRAGKAQPRQRRTANRNSATANKNNTNGSTRPINSALRRTIQKKKRKQTKKKTYNWS